MFKRWLMMTLLLLALVACGGNGNNGNNGNSNGNNEETSGEPVATNTISMNTTDFVPEAVTIAVDSSLTLKAEGFVPHFIANGTWVNGDAVEEREAGAPEVNDLQIDGGKEGTIGPFTEAGTFEFYCTIHPGMNLTVTVE